MTSSLKNNEGANGLSPLVLRPCHYSTAIHNSTHGLRTSQLGAHQHTASRPWSLSISLHPFSPPGIHNPSDSSIAMRHFRPIPRPTTLFFPLPGFVCGRVCHFTQTALTIWVPYQMHTRHPMPSSIHNSAPHNTPHPLGVLPCLIAILEILHTVHASASPTNVVPLPRARPSALVFAPSRPAYRLRQPHMEAPLQRTAGLQFISHEPTVMQPCTLLLQFPNAFSVCFQVCASPARAGYCTHLFSAKQLLAQPASHQRPALTLITGSPSINVDLNV